MDTDLLEAVLRFDRSNMEEILRSSDFGDFPWEKWIKGLLDGKALVFAAFSDGELAGYLELQPERLGDGAVHVASLQIAPAGRGGRAFRRDRDPGARYPDRRF